MSKAEEKSLYRVRTRGCGTFYVVATSFDSAASAVYEELNGQDYGLYNQRTIVNIDFLCCEEFMDNGRRLLGGDIDENHLIVAKED